MGLLPPGTEVEVRLDGKGYYGTWIEATIVDIVATPSGRAPARYRVTFDDNSKRQFNATQVRPRPPLRFCPYDIVEVNHGRGWWSGLVLSADPRSVTVAFPITREVITYMPHLVRHRRDYIDGVWVPSHAVVVLQPKSEIRRYKVGEEVEVVRERKLYGHSWFLAKVVKVIDEFSYIVEYSDQKEECGISEYLHWQFIRPSVKHMIQENEFQLKLVPGATVEAYYDGAWSAGRVRMIQVDGKFVIRINGKHSKELMTNDVRLQYKWDGMGWSIASTERQTNFKQALASRKRPKSHVEVPFNCDEDIHGAKYSCAKRSMKAQQKQAVLGQGSQNASVSKMDTPLSALEHCLTSTCSRYGHSTHPKTVVPSIGDNALEKLALTYLDVDDEDGPAEADDIVGMGGIDADADVEVDIAETDPVLEMLKVPPPIFKTPKKKKPIKVKERLDDSFLRRSKRIAKKAERFKNEASANKAKEATGAGAGAAEENEDLLHVNMPVPLAVIPGPAPHLSKEILDGIGHGFLQIQPAVVTAALLNKDDLDD